MGLPLTAPFERCGPFPIDETLTMSMAQMRAVHDNVMPELYLCLCTDDKQLYIYDKDATPSPETGKYKLYASSSGTDNALIATYGSTAAQEIISYIEGASPFAPILVKRGEEYYTVLQIVKQSNEQVYLRTLGSISGRYHVFTYIVNNATWRTTAEAIGDTTFEFEQTTPATEWTITHTLKKFPSVTIVDSAGNVVVGDVQYVDTANVVITFQWAFAGKAYLN